MGVRGHGIDLVDVARIERMLARHGEAFRARCFSARERAYAEGRPREAEHLAARFAAKEATLKALGTGLRAGLQWREIEVDRDELGRPLLRLSGEAEGLARERGIERWHVSLTHTAASAMASVIGEG